MESCIGTFSGLFHTHLYRDEICFQKRPEDLNAACTSLPPRSSHCAKARNAIVLHTILDIGLFEINPKLLEKHAAYLHRQGRDFKPILPTHVAWGSNVDKKHPKSLPKQQACVNLVYKLLKHDVLGFMFAQFRTPKLPEFMTLQLNRIRNLWPYKRRWEMRGQERKKRDICQVNHDLTGRFCCYWCSTLFITGILVLEHFLFLLNFWMFESTVITENWFDL